MNIAKIKVVSMLIYIILCLLIKHFGLFMPYIEKTIFKHCYSHYQQIAKQTQTSETAGIIIQTHPFKIKKINKKIIGSLKKNNEQYFITNTGELIKHNKKSNKYITVSGEYHKWPHYYKQLEKHPNLLKKIFQVHIYPYRLDLYLLPGVLFQLQRSIKNAAEFFEQYPEYFIQPNYYIDIRNAKQIAYDMINLTQKERNHFEEL